MAQQSIRLKLHQAEQRQATVSGSMLMNKASRFYFINSEVKLQTSASEVKLPENIIKNTDKSEGTGTPERKRLLARPRHKWEDKIKIG